MAQTLTGATISATYKTLLKAGTQSGGSVALSTGSTTERLVFGEDDAADVRTAIYVSQDRVGIGTASPLGLLHIEGSEGTDYNAAAKQQDVGTGLIINNTNTNDVPNFSQVHFEVNGGGSPTFARIVCVPQSTNNSALAFCVDAAGTYKEAMRIIQNGNVGIGTDAPSILTHIYANDASAAQLRIEQDSTGDAALSFRLTDEVASIIGMDNTDNALKFSVDSNALETNTAMTILTSGNIGIGTATPYQELHVEGDIAIGDRADNFSRYVGVSQSSGDISTYTGSIGFHASGTHVDLSFRCVEAGDNWYNMWFQNKGNLGIGEDATLAAFHADCQKNFGLLNGVAPGGAAANTSGLVGLSGELNYWDASGNVATLDSLSDERSKGNITVIPDALSRIENLKGVTFNYVSYKNSTLPFKDAIADGVTFASHDKYGDDNRVGVIAQDVEKAYDGLNITNAVMELPVESTDADNPKVYGKILKTRESTIIPLLIEAVKELSAKVTALENA